MKTVNERDALRAYIKTFDTQREAAARLGLYPSHVCEILKGFRQIPERVLHQLGLQRVVIRKAKTYWELSQQKLKRG